jgi:isopentenyl-diphosphate delta-isomerase
MLKDNIITITLVDKDDNVSGYEEKLLVHQKGLLHRAFSILIFNKKGEMLIHQRALSKYHSPGLWTNACCGHPNKGETVLDAAHRRLGEEMGFDSPLHYQFKFHYQAELENGLIENEIDHVYFGEYNDTFIVNPNEVEDFKWVVTSQIKEETKSTPENFTVWFRKIMIEI